MEVLFVQLWMEKTPPIKESCCGDDRYGNKTVVCVCVCGWVRGGFDIGQQTFVFVLTIMCFNNHNQFIA